jgi:hypothetical protein
VAQQSDRPIRVARGLHDDYGVLYETGTGDPGEPLPVLTRLIDPFCRDEPPSSGVLQGLHVAYDPDPILAYAFSCCDAIPPHDPETGTGTGDGPVYVRKDCWPIGEGPGLARNLFLYLADVENCCSARGVRTELTYSDSDHKWHGAVSLRGGTLSLTFECVPSDPLGDPGSLRLTWSGCDSGSSTTGASCFDPLVVLFQQITLPNCCSCDVISEPPESGTVIGGRGITDVAPEVNVWVVGNCTRIRFGIHVDYAVGQGTGTSPDELGAIGHILPVMANHRDCQWDQGPCIGCHLKCPLVARVSSDDDCACLSDQVDLSYAEGTWFGSGGHCGFLGTTEAAYGMTCTDLGNGRLRLSMAVVCGVDNTGSASIEIDEDDLENLDVTFTIALTDPTAGATCTGSCFYQKTMAGWSLASSTCSESCDPCGEEPSDPTPEEEASGEAVRPCTGVATPPDCCVGTITVRVTRD